MVMRVMRWPLWTDRARKFNVNLTVHSLRGSLLPAPGEDCALLVDVKWKGPKSALASRFRKSVKRVRSTPQAFLEEAVEWNEDFSYQCILSATGKGATSTFQPWDVYVVIRKVLPDDKGKPPIAGTVCIDVATFAAAGAESANHTVSLPVLATNGTATSASLTVTIDMVEIRSGSELESPFRGGGSAPEVPPPQEYEPGGGTWSGIGYNSAGGGDTPEDRREDGSERLGTTRSGTPNLLDLSEVEELTDDTDTEAAGDEVADSAQIPQALRYGTIAEANMAVAEAVRSEVEDAEAALPMHTYLDGPFAKVPVLVAGVEEPNSAEGGGGSPGEGPPGSASMLGLLAWRKRKLSFRSPRVRGQALLDKSSGEEGGDEIDWERRQVDADLSSWPSTRRRASDAEPEDLTGGTGSDTGVKILEAEIGAWHVREIVSRDGMSTVKAQVFFGSFDQRSESAAGEAACSPLVVVVADWLHQNPGLLPSLPQLDQLIRNGSAEWRKLCSLDTFEGNFQDKHFDIETVVQSHIRPLRVDLGKSYTGFFHPQYTGGMYDFLDGAMTFDAVWDAMSLAGPATYIVSWNDHFFVLHVAEDWCCILDTLGERLFEGCTRAFMLKFDGSETFTPFRSPSAVRQTKDKDVVKKKDGQGSKTESEVVGREEKSEESEAKEKKGERLEAEGAAASLPETKKEEGEQACADETKADGASSNLERDGSNEGESCGGQASEKAELEVGRGKAEEVRKGEVHLSMENCRRFVKDFLAALPLSNLAEDIRRGRLEKVPVQQRLQKVQIEFHCTETTGVRRPSQDSIGDVTVEGDLRAF